MTPTYNLETIGTNSIYIKREDLIPFSFGGNKARKGLLFFKEIEAGGYDSVVTYGSGSSNHCRVISNYCAANGLDCYIISPYETDKVTFNSRFLDLFGAHVIKVPVNEVHDTIENKLSELRKAGKKPYHIEGGGHGNIGTEAYVRCYREIQEWEKENQIKFDYIFFASGTGTTQAGLVCGQILSGEDREVVGISIARRNPYGRNIVLNSIRSYLNEKAAEGMSEVMIDAEMEEKIEAKTIFIDDFTGDGYGHDNQEILETIRQSMTRFGIPMDVTYTGKAYTGMKKYIEKYDIRNKNILFIHTGGTPLFFDFIQKKD